MSEGHRTDIEELLSCYVDGELSDRGRTEVKRLIQHDESVAAKLLRMEKQKQLLNSLPIASAPAGLVEDIKGRLAKRPISERFGLDADESAGARHLLYRRVLTAAAMFMLVGVLAVVVFNIIMPGPAWREEVAINGAGSPEAGTESKEAVVDSGGGVEAVDSYPFRATLELATYDLITVNGFIAKAIYNNNLVDSTIPKRQAIQSDYHITCTTGQIVGLLDELEAVWDGCERICLTMYGETVSSDIVIDDVTSAQAIAVFAQDKPEERVELAKNFADFNALIRGRGDEGIFASGSVEEKTEFVPSVPIKPALTRPEQPLVREDQPETGGNVNLIITVTGL
jgi:hypothetical protein